jgi:hypothetical protein
MSAFNNILNWGPFSRVRRNHALEHATLQVLAERNPQLRMAGYSDPSGFWLIGQIETEEVETSVRQALDRLRGGEHSLAIHPHCGTNLVTTGFLAGIAAWLGMLGAGRGTRDRIERLPLIMSLVTVSMILSQPVGPFLQARVTTAAATQGLEITKVRRLQRGDTPLHRIETRF